MEGTPPGQFGQPPAGQPGPGGYPPQSQGYTQPQPGYGQPQQGYGGAQGPGAGERAGDAAQALGRHIHTPETKPFFKTSEFAVWLLTVIGVLIAGAVVDTSNGQQADVFRADKVWTLIAVVSFAYIISRGISKAGTKYR